MVKRKFKRKTILWLVGIFGAIGGALLNFSSVQTRDLILSCPPVGEISKNEKIHFVKMGEGPSLIFLHGAGTNLRDFLGTSLVENLSRDHTVYLVDRPGSGYSPLSYSKSNMDEQITRLASFIESQKIEKPILVGHSMGGAVAAALAAKMREKAGGLLLLAAAVYPIGTGSSWYTHLATAPIVGSLFRNLVIPWVGPQILPGILEKNFSPNSTPQGYLKESCVGLLFEPNQFRNNAEALNEVVPFMKRNLPSYKDISVPVTMIYGRDDKVIATFKHSGEFKKIVSHAKLLMLEETGHLPHHAHPELVEREIRQLRQNN